MKAQAPAKTRKTASGDHKPPAKPHSRRISAKIRAAIKYRVRHALTWAECAQRAGMSETGLHLARRRQEVKALYEQEKNAFIAEAESLEPIHKARALEVAREILDTGKSEAARARMVEFLRGESKPGTSISLNLQQNFTSAGYFYPPPGARMVEIQADRADLIEHQPARDSVSPAPQPQPVENERDPE